MCYSVVGPRSCSKGIWRAGAYESVRVLKGRVGTNNFIIVFKRRLLLCAATMEFTSENKSGRTEIAQNVTNFSQTAATIVPVVCFEN